MSRLSVTIDGVTYNVEVQLPQGVGSAVPVVVDGETLRVTLPEPPVPDQVVWLLVDGRSIEIELDHNLRWLRSARGLHHLEIRDLETPVTRPTSGDGRVRAPIPGVIARVLVSAGDQVEAGQPLVVLEAMKMENQISAPRAGTVGQVHVAVGQNVALNAMLTEIV